MDDVTKRAKFQLHWFCKLQNHWAKKNTFSIDPLRHILSTDVLHCYRENCMVHS